MDPNRYELTTYVDTVCSYDDFMPLEQRPRSGDVIHPQLRKIGSGYETTVVCGKANSLSG